MATVEYPIRVVMGKPGLDGHDRGAKVVACALRDAGMEVIYLGLRQSIQEIVRAGIQEGANVIGLSILSGAHVSLCHKLIRELEEKGAKDDFLLVVGGIIPTEEDAETLKKMGIHGVFPVGSSFESIIEFIKANVKREAHK